MRSVPLILASSLIFASSSGAQDPVAYHVVINGGVGLTTTRTVARALAVASEGTGALLVLELNSAGGQFAAAQLIASDLLASDVPIYVLVTTMAWGPGALVALAADSLFMAPESSIGAGERDGDAELSLPARTAVEQEFHSLAARRGVDPDVGLAMGRSPSATGALTLPVSEAVDRGVAHGEVRHLGALLARAGMDSTHLITVGSDWAGTTVEIENNNTRDVRAYVLRGGTRYTLGLATSMRVSTFTLPVDQLSEGSHIRVFVQVVGSSEQRLTEEIRVEPGLVIRWALEDPLRYSKLSYFVRYY